ncbi:hypothetical protein AMELA_G00211650 [Ameiurus melas]|uniref:Uncharacterized protein n=1 Tax=Ameiurus melas TaxID=219545 RepID=A0A7J6A4G9_AMEME|nr:hypothetical protein AMELA_G00211650 [Ameiurus melas]
MPLPSVHRLHMTPCLRAASGMVTENLEPFPGSIGHEDWTMGARSSQGTITYTLTHYGHFRHGGNRSSLRKPLPHGESM